MSGLAGKGMSRDFFTAALRTKPSLLRAMLAFNGVLACPPLPTPLPTALAGVPQAARLWTHPAVRRRCGGSCAADPDFWDFEDEVFRLAFLDAATLDRLALTFGVAVLAPEICRLLRRAEVCAARERLGELYAYALHRARFQVNEISSPFCTLEAPLDVRAQALGAWGLRALTRRCPPVLQSRFARLRPASGMDTILDTEQQTRLWADMKKVLLKEVAPAWTPCFD